MCRCTSRSEPTVHTLLHPLPVARDIADQHGAPASHRLEQGNGSAVGQGSTNIEIGLNEKPGHPIFGNFTKKGKRLAHSRLAYSLLTPFSQWTICSKYKSEVWGLLQRHDPSLDQRTRSIHRVQRSRAQHQCVVLPSPRVSTTEWFGSRMKTVQLHAPGEHKDPFAQSWC